MTEPPALSDVREKLLHAAARLIDSLDDQTIGDAPLNQRAQAVGIVVDRLLKLDFAQESPVIRVEFIDADDNPSESPPWADDDPAQQSPLPSSGLRAAFWQDRAGQAAAD